MSFFAGSTPKDHATSSDLFHSANFSSNTGSAGPSSPSVPSAFDTFSSAYDPVKLHPFAGLGDKLDFLQLEEDKLTDVQGAASVLPSRGWTDDLCVGTGTTYLSGLATGGVWGFKEGWSRQLGQGASFKLRLNSILNGCTRRGTLLGNSLGVLAIFYNLANSSMDSIRGKHDFLNSMTAAAASGAMYKATAGLKPAAISAGLMAGAAGAWSGLKTMV